MKPRKLNHIITYIAAIIGLTGAAYDAGATLVANPVYQDIDSFQHMNANGTMAVGVLLDKDNPVQTGVFDLRSGQSDDTTTVKIAGNAAGANAYMNAGTTYHDILGFVPGSSTVTSASAYFYLRGANGANDVYSINLSDYILGSVDGRGDYSRIILDGSLGSLALDLLSEDGYLNYSVTRDGGSFWLDYAQLQVAEVQVTAVPETSTSIAGLLTVGFAAATTMRKFRKRQA